MAKAPETKPSETKPPEKTAPPRRAAPAKRPLPTSIKDRLEMVLNCNKPCARRVKELKALGSAAPPAELRRLPQLVNQCVETCR